jgi:hypothetical protein
MTLGTRMRTSALAGLMLRINCPIFQPLACPLTSPSPPFPSIHANIYYHHRLPHAQIFFYQAQYCGVMFGAVPRGQGMSDDEFIGFP